MPAGLQIWDAAGNQVVDFTTRLSQNLGILTLPDGHGAGSISVPGFVNGAPYAHVLTEQRFNTTTGARKVPTKTSCAGTTLSYEAGDACTIIYGTY